MFYKLGIKVVEYCFEGSEKNVCIVKSSYYL